jgi:hypothetical protein
MNSDPTSTSQGATPAAHAHKERFEIFIDRMSYVVTHPEMTGEQLRRVPPTPIGPDRDLFERIQGGSDLKIENATVVKIRDGLRFFTVPAHINPGALMPGQGVRHVATS